MSSISVTRSDVDAAARRLAGVIRRTPAYRSDAISAVCGRPVWLKPEHLQRTGSFKIRGAYNRISRLDPGTEVVAASAGNHAQGVALAAALSGVRATIFMPASVSLPKLQATRGYGAVVELVPGSVDDALAAARSACEGAGAVWVPPFEDPFIVAGQGTIGLELHDEAPPDATVLVPVGGGGLVTGVAAGLDDTERPVVGVRPVDPLATMADGVAVRDAMPVDVPVVTAGEEDISRAVLLLLERAKAVVEPAGALGLAALLGGHVDGDGPIVCVLSGGNVDPMLLGRLVDHGLTAAGRYLVCRVVLADRPGQLAALSAAIAELAVNVLSIEHHREGVGLALGDAEVRLTLETRDHDHRREVVDRLRSAGFAVEV